jgi:phosphopentomutase
MKYKRIFTIVLDSMGIGAMPDCEKFGDSNVDTLGHISKFRGTKGFKIPNLQKLGLANLKQLTQVPPVKNPEGYFCAMNELSNGKDTMTGHWEMMGIKTTKPFITFTDNGFPPELIKELEEQTGHIVIGNKAASGTDILDELAEEEIKSNGKKMIVYTSADSVLQICGNEEVFGLEELYRCCKIAREITMKDEWRVGRVIARPYLGRKKGEFKRTSNRYDYALKPTDTTTLNMLKDAGLDVIAVGKINNIFVSEGITETNHSISSVNGMEQTIEIAKRDFKGLCFVNLVDFDALWGHRRNPEGYASEIEKFDVKLAELQKVMNEDDLLILTADHGNDPTAPGTDHTREKVPFLAWSPSMKKSGLLPETDTFGVIGATIADNFGVKNAPNAVGYSILDKLQ